MGRSAKSQALGLTSRPRLLSGAPALTAGAWALIRNMRRPRKGGVTLMTVVFVESSDTLSVTEHDSARAEVAGARNTVGTYSPHSPGVSTTEFVKQLREDILAFFSGARFGGVVYQWQLLEVHPGWPDYPVAAKAAGLLP
jgi:hypothetical protein